MEFGCPKFCDTPHFCVHIDPRFRSCPFMPFDSPWHSNSACTPLMSVNVGQHSPENSFMVLFYIKVYELAFRYTTITNKIHREQNIENPKESSKHHKLRKLPPSGFKPCISFNLTLISNPIPTSFKKNIKLNHKKMYLNGSPKKTPYSLPQKNNISKVYIHPVPPANSP